MYELLIYDLWKIFTILYMYFFLKKIVSWSIDKDPKCFF